MNKFSLLTYCLSLVLLFTATAGAAVTPARLSIVRDNGAYLAFAVDSDFNLFYYTSQDGETWTKGKQVNPTPGMIVSNPSAVSVYDAQLKRDVIIVYAQGKDGQVYGFLKSSTSLEFKQFQLSSKLPVTTVTQPLLDTVHAISHNNLSYVFVQSHSNTSQLYWNIFDPNLKPTYESWTQVLTQGFLVFSAFPAVNSFNNRVEVFTVLSDFHVFHIWQTGPKNFSIAWEKLGGLFSPKFSSAPVVHQMSHSDFNGVLNLFVRGVDDLVHHMSQTTCDNVKNPWGPCTWSSFSKIGSEVPAARTDANPLSIVHNIHLGIEVFVVGEKDGSLYHMWQSERDGRWSQWEELGPTPSGGFASEATLVIDDQGWWQAIGFVKYPDTISRFARKPFTFTLSPSTVEFDKNVTVSWAIPNDEATHKDWIGVYPKGAASHQYIDFAYVGGTQNPLKDPVPKGSINFTATLPNGVYSYQYMVNKEYVSVLETSATVEHSTTDLEWEQIYKGIARGLGGINDNITECVVDGNRTIETFRDAFTAFEDRQIFEGLHLFAQGLSDVRDTLTACDETVIVEDLSKFITALISCTEGNCAKFLVDIAVEIVILWEHEYEIYGDIQAANNCFKIDAYQQGGVCIGRVTNACLTRM